MPRLLLPFLEFCYSIARTFLGPLRSGPRGLSRERSLDFCVVLGGREDTALMFYSSLIKLALSFVL